MTTKGSLQASIPIVKAFYATFFKSRQKLAKISVWGKMGSKCKILFSGPPKGTSLRETTSFDVLIVKIGVDCRGLDCRGLDCRGLDCRGLDCRGLDCRGLDCRRKEEPKKTSRVT